MDHSKVRSLIRNIPRKIMAIIIGYHCWLIISSWLPAYQWIDVPMCFDHKSDSMTITAPESIRILLMGSRTALANIDTQTLAVHIDTHALIHGNNPLILSDHQLLLPPQLHVLDWSPSNIVIAKHDDSNNQGNNS